MGDLSPAQEFEVEHKVENKQERDVNIENADVEPSRKKMKKDKKRKQDEFPDSGNVSDANAASNSPNPHSKSSLNSMERKKLSLEECEANLVVYLHPSKAKCASDAILHALSSMLFTYNETLGGVVLAYDPSIQSNLAKILPGIFPCFGVQLKAKLLLFNPKPDMVLEGEVVKLTSHSIHVVVLGFSSAVIADDDIRDEFKHKVKSGEEVYVSRSHRKHKIKVGTILRFSVKSFDEEILHISGSLLAHHTGCARWLDKHLDEWSQHDSTATTKNIGDGQSEKLSNDRSVIDGESALKNNEQIDKSKRRRVHT